MNRDLDPKFLSTGSFEEPPWIVAGIIMDRRDPSDPGRVLRTEVDPADVRQWHALTRHLVQGHGGEPNRLISHELTLDQIRFAHADTHLALTFIDADPPDRHAHSGPLDAGEPTPRLASYFPFWRSLSADGDLLTFPAPVHTGLPHTGLYHVSFAELAGWAAGQLPRRLTSPAAEDDAQWAHFAEKLGVTEATRAEWIKANADRASGRPGRRHDGLPPDRADFPDKVRPVAPARGLAAGSPLHSRRTRQAAPRKGGRTP